MNIYILTNIQTMCECERVQVGNKGKQRIFRREEERKEEKIEREKIVLRTWRNIDIASGSAESNESE